MKDLLFVLLVIIFISGCSNDFELDKNVTGKNIKLINQDSVQVQYPEIIKNKIAVIGFIYTHCPDICPMTTHNMQLAQEQLSKEDLKNVKFLLVSFDPERDTPSILSKYAYVRDMNMSNWELLTGNKENVNILLNEFNVKAFPDDTTYNDKGEPQYFIIHTDRISLVDENGNLRKNYKGSTAKPEEIVKDVKKLL
jgi:protein SCO1